MRQQHAQHRKPISQLSVTGVSLAVMSRRQADAPEPWVAAAGPGAPTAAPPAAVQGAVPVAGSNAKLGAQRPDAAAIFDLATALATEGWRECHVLLRQWQCTVALCAAERASKSSEAAAQAAKQNRSASSRQGKLPPAIVLQYQTAGVNEVSTDNWALQQCMVCCWVR